MESSEPPDSPPSAPEELERALGLHPEDRGDLPGLYRLNVERVPRFRILGFQLLLAFAALHNLVLDTGVDWRGFLVVALVVEAYAFGQHWVLQEFFTRVRRVHLGTLFLVLDVVAFTGVIWATGAHRSWLWPVYLVRVADQMFIGRRRAALMGLVGVGCYAALLAGMGLTASDPFPWGAEALEVAILAALAGYMVLAAELPWDLQARTRAAKELIQRLERQSLELQEERARAEAASRAKGEFLAQMSHELRTPLNAVVGFARLLLKERDGEAVLGERERGFAQRIYDNAVHLLRVISDILDISRIQEGSMEMRPSTVDVEALAREVVDELEDRARPGVRIFLSFPRALEPIQADRARLRQVVVNLVDNALKFTHEGWVRVEVLSDPETGRARELRVVDTGVGIETEDMGSVFEPFQQVSAGLDRRYEGTGLGLAIARALCQRMGFSLTVKSAPGQGSTFAVVLNGNAETSAEHEEGRPGEQGAPPGPEVMDVSPGRQRPG